MKVIIIEDEKAAVRNLVALLHELEPDIEIATTLDSINATIEWFSVHQMPDLLFIDIHLADGSAFEIFDHININCPVIFTTAYDEYALKAFRVNSIDYLLKPIDKEDMKRALGKFKHLHKSNIPTSLDLPDNALTQLMASLRQRESYKTHFLIPAKGDKLLPIPVSSISFFYIKESQVKAVLNNGTELSFYQTLDELTECLNPQTFFRANRQFLISKEAIKDIDLWFNNRLSVNLHHSPTTERVIVSKTRVKEFKQWFSGE